MGIGGIMLNDPVNDILEKYKREGKVSIISEKESAEASNRINEEMRKVRVEYNRKSALSIQEAEKLYLTF
jgi:hypothetical protein